MQLKTMQGWVKKKQEILAVAGLILLIGVLIYFGLQTQQKYFGEDESVEEKPVEKVKLSGKKETSEGAVDSETGTEEGRPVKSFFLAPSPAEIMALVQDIASSEIPVPQEKYENLRIVWPTYFFKIAEQGPEMVKVMFDTSRDGFGINIVSEINHLKYPEILTAEPYQKIWLAGEIEAIDPEGTGTIYMAVEQVRFGEELKELRPAKNPAATKE